jgi:hypothetical protein
MLLRFKPGFSQIQVRGFSQIEVRMVMIDDFEWIRVERVLSWEVA